MTCFCFVLFCLLFFFDGGRRNILRGGKLGARGREAGVKGEGSGVKGGGKRGLGTPLSTPNKDAAVDSMVTHSSKLVQWLYTKRTCRQNESKLFSNGYYLKRK